MVNLVIRDQKEDDTLELWLEKDEEGDVKLMGKKGGETKTLVCIYRDLDAYVYDRLILKWQRFNVTT